MNVKRTAQLARTWMKSLDWVSGSVPGMVASTVSTSPAVPVTVCEDVAVLSRVQVTRSTEVQTV